jgi:hypothetical protein
MEQIYQLRKRETIRVPIQEPGRRHEFERYEIFEFVPKAPLDSNSRLEAQSVKGL